jgi:Ser/Thr protein kinase RdoA (MazF antagonist)/AraC-like DNA-binding protein
MTKNEIIKEGMDYIEQNLTAEITAAELATCAGYSVWHYCRLFSEATGYSVAGYIRKRRLERALSEISGGRAAIDAVLEYGFDTYAGFYKAFVKMYGCSPKKYLAIYSGHKAEKSEVKHMYSKQELRKILDSWSEARGLPIGSVSVADGTRMSDDVWSVGDKYYLKTGGRDALQKGVTIAKALSEKGLCAALPIPTSDGSELTDTRPPFVLTAKIPGAPLGKAERFGENREEYARKYGKALARLHGALREIEGDVLPDEVDLYAQVAQWALSTVQKQNEQWSLGLPDSFFDDYIASFGRQCACLPKQLIHRDPNPSNILFENGEVTGFIDFDLSERNTRLWDVCYCATGILSEWRGAEDVYEKWPDILRGILHGYDSAAPLTEEEKRAVYNVLCSIVMLCAAYFGASDEWRELAHTNREMLLYIARSRARIEDIF